MLFLKNVFNWKKKMIRFLFLISTLKKYLKKYKMSALWKVEVTKTTKKKKRIKDLTGGKISLSAEFSRGGGWRQIK